MDHHDDPSENDEGQVYQTETFVFTGNGGPALLATMQNLMNRMMHGQQLQQQQQPMQGQQLQPQQQPAQSEQSEQSEGQVHPEQSGLAHSEDADMSAADDPPVPEIPPTNDEGMPPLEPLSGDGTPGSRPMRPLPRPHAHFHAHTPGGIIDLFTFNIAGPPPPPPPGAASFTFNLGPDMFAGFEAFFLGGMQKEREPDPERAKVLLRGMEVVPEGLVRRLERAGGVPGGQGSEDGAGCAVCWGPLLDEVDPGEWDTTKEKEERTKMAADDKERGDNDDNEPHARIVALPCAHVYHADCLLPWFSRNTTCPMCRFDVDPESLTWTPRPPAAEPPPPPPPASDIPPENPSDATPPPPPPPGTEDSPNEPADQHRQANAAQAARFNAFLNSILRATPFVQQQQPQQPATQTQHQGQQQQNPPQPVPLVQTPQQPQNPNESPLFGPSPPPPPPPNPFVLPPLFRMPMPLFVVPQNGQPNAAGDDTNVPSPPQPPPVFHDVNSPPNIHAQMPPLAYQWPPDDPHTLPLHPHPLPTSPPPPPRRERKKWTPPEPVGKTLRQRVEEKERELGLRCDDMVCGVAPSDEDPTPVALQSASGTKRITVRAAYDAHGKACEHSFHPACLVTSARVAGVTGDEETLEGRGEKVVQNNELQVACPVCRAVGFLTREEWDEGVQASEAEMA